MKNKIISATAHSTGLGLQFVALVLMSTIYDKIEYAELALLLTFASLAAVFSRYGAQPTILKLGVNKYDKSIFHTVLITYPFIISIASFISALLYGILYDRSSTVFPLFLVVMSLSLNGISSILYRLNGNITSAIISTKPLEQILLVFVLLISYFFYYNSNESFLIFSIILFCFSLTQVFFRYSKVQVNLSDFDRLKIGKEIILLSTLSMLVNFLQILQKNIDVLLLGFFEKGEIFASYVFAQKISEFFFFFIPLLNMYFIKHFSKVIKDKLGIDLIKQKVLKFYKLAIFIFIFLFALFLIFKGLIFEHLFTEFEDSIEFIIVFSFGKFFLILTSPLTMILLVNEQAKYLILSLLVSILFIIPCFFIFKSATILCYIVSLSYLLFFSFNAFFVKSKLDLVRE